MALTIVPDGKSGRFVLVQDSLGSVGYGRAKVSKSHPGYITLTMLQTHPPYDLRGIPLRVPIDWIATMEALEDV